MSSSEINKLTYKYYHKANSNKVVLILHGGGPNGVEAEFIKEVFDAIMKLQCNVFAFNFKYCERGDEMSSGPELKEEQGTLLNVISFLREEGNQEIIVVAKSLSAVTYSYLLDTKPQEFNDCKLIILGLVKDEVKLPAVSKSLIAVIQGQQDKYGDPVSVADSIKEVSASAKVLPIENADHSYRNENKEPIYQEEAIRTLINELILLV